MTSLDDPAAGMSKIHVPEGGMVTLQLDGDDGFAERCPEQYRAVVDPCAFVNWRLIEVGEPVVLALSYYGSR